MITRMTLLVVLMTHPLAIAGNQVLWPKAFGVYCNWKLCSSCTRARYPGQWRNEYVPGREGLRMHEGITARNRELVGISLRSTRPKGSRLLILNTVWPHPQPLCLLPPCHNVLMLWVVARGRHILLELLLSSLTQAELTRFAEVSLIAPVVPIQTFHQAVKPFVVLRSLVHLDESHTVDLSARSNLRNQRACRRTVGVGYRLILTRIESPRRRFVRRLPRRGKPTIGITPVDELQTGSALERRAQGQTYHRKIPMPYCVSHQGCATPAVSSPARSK
eukprot:scaffold998_cov411-Prasinococcus_capsulatus_cf.AAC.25